MRDLILSDKNANLMPKAEALLLAADRAMHAEEVIRPALSRGEIVLCDRYLDSSVAYQGVARGLGATFIRDLSMWATGQLVPDVTLYFDIAPSAGLARRQAAGNENRIDLEQGAFHEKVRAAFCAMAQAEPTRFVLLNAEMPPDYVAKEALSAVRRAALRRGIRAF